MKSETKTESATRKRGKKNKERAKADYPKTERSSSVTKQLTGKRRDRLIYFAKH